MDVPSCWTLVCAAVIGFVLGAIPAFVGLPANLSVALREEGRGGTSGRGARTLRRLLVVTQVAVAFVLLIGAGLLFASFRQVVAIDPGFKADGVLTASINMPLAQSRYYDAAVSRFADAAVRAIRSIPGVVAVGATSTIPFGDTTARILLPEGYTLGPDGSVIAPYASRITPGYFEAMSVRFGATVSSTSATRPTHQGGDRRRTASSAFLLTPIRLPHV